MQTFLINQKFLEVNFKLGIVWLLRKVFVVPPFVLLLVYLVNIQRVEKSEIYGILKLE